MAFAGVSVENIKAASSTSILTTTTTGLAVSQTTASITATTLKNSIRGIKTEIKNLTTDIKNFAFLHPELLALAGTILAIGAAIKIVNAVQDWADGTTAVNKYNKSIEKSEENVSKNSDSISEYSSTIEENKQKIEELQKLQEDGTITEAQKAEIENLKYQNALLDEKIEKLKEANNEEVKTQARDSEKAFNKQFGNGFDVGSNASDVISSVSKNFNGDGTANGVSWNMATSGNDKDTAVAQLAKIKLATDAYNDAVKELNNATDEDQKVLAEQSVENAQYTLDLLTKDFDKNKETLYNQLTSEMEKMKKAEGTDAYDATAYANMQSWLKIFQQYIPEYKKAMEKVQEEADKNPIEQSVEVKSFDDPTSLLTESDDKSKTATLADLQSEADLLSTIQKELSDNGKISVSSMQSIIKQYPEAKKALSEYLLGIISEEELFAELEGVYENDKDAYIKSVIEKAKTDEDFFNTLKTNYPELINQLGAVYGTDVANWTTMEQAKVNITAQAIQQIANIYKEFYKAMGVNDGIDFNIQATKNAISAGNPGAIGGSLFSKSYSKSNFDKVVTDNNHKFKMNGNDVSNAYKELQNNIDSVWNTAEKMKNAIDDAAYNQINASIDTSWQGLGGSDSSSSSQSAEKLNWIERLINKISTAYSRLKNVVSDTTTTWLNRNNALSDSMSTLADEINAQSDAYEYYMNAFNSYGLDDYYKNQIADGSISIDVIYDDDLKNAISDCQDFYDKAQDAKTAVQELNIELKGLAKSRFDNVASEFEEKINKIVAVRDLYSKEDELMNEKGWFSSTLLNSAMIDQENKNLQKLEAERDALVNALNSAVSSGSIDAESEDWYSMQSAIDEVSSSILDAKKALIEYDNTIRQINWDAFDRTRDDVENLINETDFLTELLKDVGITDDNGNMTKEGQAAQALLAQKYQLYLNQAKAYKDEVAKIDADLVNDPYDKELLDRKQDLIDKEQEAIKSAMSEKDAIKDLTNDAYSDFIDKLGDAIDKYKELMSTMKDAYDYEKSIREKTEALNALEKQYSAYQGDNSEEGKKNIQQLKDKINSAKDDLKDTEYEKLISDTEKILDTLKSDTQEWLDQRLDQLDNLIQDIIDQSNNNASDIAETITSTAENYGYKLSESMASIWSTNTGNITKVLDNFSTNFIDSNSKIKDVCDNINSAVQGLLANSNAEAQRVADEIAKQQAEQNASSDGGYSGGSDYSSDDWSGNWDTGSDDNGSSGSDGVDWIYSKDYFDKNSLNIDTSIVDRLKLHDYDSSFAARSQYYDQMGGEGQYYATYDQNVWMLDWMKSHGYRKGTKSATSGVHIYDEDDPGSEVLVTKYGVLRQFDSGDTVFNKDQVEKLWNLSKGITTPNMYMDNLGAKLPDISNMSSNLSNKVDVQFGDVTLSLPNVRNYEDFMKEAQKDPKFEKMIQNMTLGQTLGRNSLNKLTFR